jgi:hypothetical protein
MGNGFDINDIRTDMHSHAGFQHGDLYLPLQSIYHMAPTMYSKYENLAMGARGITPITVINAVNCSRLQA